MPHLVVTNIILSHHFISHPGWYSDEYALARLYSGIVYVLEGYAEYIWGDGNRLGVRAGDCIYVPKGSVYTTRCNQTEQFVHMTVNFELLGEDDLFSVPTRHKLNSPVHFEQLFVRLVHHWTVRHPFYHEHCIGILYEMLYLLLKEMKASGNPYLEKIRPARLYLDEHFREDFPLERLSNLCGLSETYFRRLFHRVFNETPAEYRRRLRISCAKDLLLSGHYTISEVAQQCGYPDPSYFSRMFRKTLGISPSQYTSERFIQEGE
jgi:AraC-like DNA-binding protein